MSRKSKQVDKLAKILWEYNQLKHKTEKSDLIFVFGSSDLRVADKAIELYKKGFAPLIIFTGGYGRISNKLWNKSEAEKFAEIAVKKGVPEEKILIENRSSNTEDNIKFAREILENKNIHPDKILVVTKPYVERRAYATFKKICPEPEIIVTSPNISYEEYPDHRISKNEFINILVGDTQRIREYPKKGFQIKQDIPDNVWEAYEELVQMGYTKHLIK